ncbi:MAG TPA: ZIP family metal transporter [Solirubrobacteraceae bacterium]|nr:ZIP family metal transporter [Solirubrobacteraceae bacterium]
MLLLLLAACATALATGFGALPVYALRTKPGAVHPVLWGLAGGVMTVASIQGLLLPALHETPDSGVFVGLLVGVCFLLVARRALGRRDLHIGTIRGADARRAVLVFAVLFVHSLPEGLALGAAWASGTAGLGVFVFLAIAVQNVPEGTATAIPLRDAGVGPSRAFWAATLTSAPQPVGAIAAYALVTSVHSLLGASFGFAAGAMLALVVAEIAPTALAGPHRRAGVAAAVGSAAVMAALGVVLSFD